MPTVSKLFPPLNARAQMYLDSRLINEFLPILTLTKCQAENPIELDYLASGVIQKNMLLEYIKLSLLPLPLTENQDRRISELPGLFQEQFSTAVPLDKYGQPKIFSKLGEAKEELLAAMSILRKFRPKNKEESSLYRDDSFRFEANLQDHLSDDSLSQINTLLRFIEVSMNTIKRKKVKESEIDFMARIRAEIVKQSRIAQEFTDNFTNHVARDENNYPIIILKIKEVIEKIDRKNKIDIIQSIFPLVTKEQLSLLSSHELQEMDNKAELFLQTLEDVRYLLNSNSIQLEACGRKTSLGSMIKKSLRFYVGWTTENPSQIYFNDPIRYSDVILTVLDEEKEMAVQNLLRHLGMDNDRAIFQRFSKRKFKLSVEQLFELNRFLVENPNFSLEDQDFNPSNS